MELRRWSGWLALLAAFVGACGGGSAGGDAGDAGDDVADGAAWLPALPALNPCPEGWVEVPPDEPDGVATCDPWPAGGPAVLSPCPDGWLETTDAETGTVACDPWPGGGPAVLSPCPDGWLETTDAETGTVACDPWPAGGREGCTAPDEAHFPGEPGCARVGTACTDDSWASGLPSDRPIRYVLAGAPAGGDGTRASPFGTIAEATAGAASGTIVALSKGTFDEVVVLASGVTLWGACVAETVVASSTPAVTAGTIQVRGRDTGLRNLRVGGRRPGVWVDGTSRSVLVQDAVIDAATGSGWLVARGGSAVGRGVVVRDTRSNEADRRFGNGLVVQSGGAADVRRAVFERNRESAVLVNGADALLTLEDAAVRDTRSREADATCGYGLVVQSGGAAEVRRAAIEGNRTAGLLATGSGTRLTLEDVAARDTESQERDAGSAQGLHAELGAAVSARRVLLDRNREFAVFLVGAGTVGTFEDLVIRNTRFRENDRQGGMAVRVESGAAAHVRRAAIEGNREVGAYAVGTGTSMTLEDVVVRDTQGRESDRQLGRALFAEIGAAVEVRRALIERSREVAILVRGAGTTATLEDLVVRDTRSMESNGEGGRGLTVGEGAAAVVRRALFERNLDVAILAARTGSTVTIEDLVVRDTGSRDADRRGGRGLGVVDGASATVLRAAFERNRDVAILAARPGTRLVLDGVAVRDTRGQEDDGAGGRGIGVQEGAALEARRTLFERNREVAVFLEGAGTRGVLEDLVVRDTRGREDDREAGRGASVENGAVAVLRRALLQRNLEVAVYAASAGTSVTLEDVVIRDTRSRESDRLFGDALDVVEEAAATADRLLIERGRAVAVVAVGAGTSVSLENVVIRDTGPAEGGGLFGIGAGAYGGGRVTLRHFSISGNAMCGVQLAYGLQSGTGLPFEEGGTMDLHDGVVSHNAVCGANVQTGGFDLGRLQDGVRWHDNGQDLDMTSLPVPEPDPGAM
jgi:hypothetical protein